MKVEVREPAATRSLVTMATAAGASASGLALVVAILTGRPLWLWSSFIALPGLIAVAGFSILMRRRQEELFLLRLHRGAIAGVLSTIAYDVVRAFVEGTGLADTNTFRAIPIFGAGLTGRAPDSAVATAAGWAFHALNGVGFAISFVLLAAGRPAWWGVVFALGLEGLMILLYPGWLGFSLTKEFVSVSILGHVAYGAVLGRFARSTA